MKYLDEMTEAELIKCANENKIVLELKFNRENIIKKLEEKGYKRSSLEKITNDEELVEEIDFSTINSLFYRSRTYYRNYPNKKLMRVLKKRYRFKLENKNELDFGFKEIDEEQIKKRELEMKVSNSKYSRGAEYEKENSEEDIYFDKKYLPESYFVDEVVLMPKNPTTLYVYWEIRDETFEKLANSNQVVDNIIIKLLKNGSEYKKIIRHERIGSHYIGEVDTSQNYEVHIGYEDKYGNFSKVAYSKQAISPSDKLSDNLDLVWGTVKEDKNTNQVIKYINSPIPTEENKEFLTLIENPYKKIDENEEFTIEVLERLLKVGASENVVETVTKSRTIKPDRLVMTGRTSS